MNKEHLWVNDINYFFQFIKNADSEKAFEMKIDKETGNWNLQESSFKYIPADKYDKANVAKMLIQDEVDIADVTKGSRKYIK